MELPCLEVFGATSGWRVIVPDLSGRFLSSGKPYELSQRNGAVRGAGFPLNGLGNLQIPDRCLLFWSPSYPHGLLSLHRLKGKQGGPVPERGNPKHPRCHGWIDQETDGMSQTKPANVEGSPWHLPDMYMLVELYVCKHLAVHTHVYLKRCVCASIYTIRYV